MIADSLRRWLESRHIPYKVHSHEPRVTAQEIAHASHVSGRHFAKTVLLEVHDFDETRPASIALAVLPADEVVDLDRLGRQLGRPVEVASEQAYARLFPGYEVGAAPPIAELAHMRVPVYVDACLAREASIAFNAGTHSDVVEMPWQEYARLTSPEIIDYGRPAAPAEP
jgi:Ala-tRNA(Pro) deacylase